MKILMICEFYDPNLEYQENILTKYYTMHGHEVVVIASTFENVFDYYSGKYNNKVPSSLTYDGKTKIIKLKYKFNFLNKIRKYISINKILEEEKPDLIYVHDIIPNLTECIHYLKRDPKCKMIMDYHADYSNSGKNWISLKILHGIIRKWYLDKSRPYLSKIFPVVPAGIKFLHEVYKVPLSEMEVLPLGADLNLCNKMKNSSILNELKQKYNIGNNDKVIITGGKLSPRKKTELLIEAFHKLDIDNKHLIIIGDSANENLKYKEKLINLSKKSKNIHFTGWLNTEMIYAHFHISTIAVFPASQSILWQQAIASGLPLITGNTGEQSIEYLNLYNNIIILEKDNITIDNLCLNIKNILNNSDLYKSMKIGAKKVANEKLDWNILIKNTLKFNK